MSMIRWDPARDLMSLRQAMNRLFEESVVRPRSLTLELGGETIPVDIYQTENEVVIKAPLPGIKPDEVDISVTENSVTIKAEKKKEQEVKEKEYFRKEMHYGTVSRTITLPTEIMTDKAEATFENGVLTLSLPKSEAVKPRQIKVQVKGEEENTTTAANSTSGSMGGKGRT